MSHPTSIRVLPTFGLPGFFTTGGLFVLQRQGAGSALQACFDRFHVSVTGSRDPSLPWLASVRGPTLSQTEKLATLEDAYAQVAAWAGRCRGETVVAAPFVAAYMFDLMVDPHRTPTLRYDRIVSPLLYDPESDTIRTVASRAVVVHFRSGQFRHAVPQIDHSARPAEPFIREALRTGFHSCDVQRGDDYCKRRLAWLAGALWLTAARQSLLCGALEPNMTAAALAPQGVQQAPSPIPPRCSGVL